MSPPSSTCVAASNEDCRISFFAMFCCLLSDGRARVLLLEVAFEPLTCQPRYFVQRAGFFEEVRRPGDDYELFFAAKLRESRPVQLDNLKIVAANDEQGRCPDARQGGSGQIGSPAARDDRAHHIGALSGRNQRGAGAGAGAEIADPKVSRVPVLREPVRGGDEPLGEEADVEAHARGP